MTALSYKNLDKVRELYYKKGYSVREIADFYNVGVSAAYYFMRKYDLKRRGKKQARQAEFLRKPLSFSLNESKSREVERLRQAGTMLYWAEGSKGGRVVDFANSDTAMCLIFMRFLREVCGVDETRLRGYIYCHTNSNSDELIKFWSKMLGIHESQFTQPYIRKYTKAQKENVNSREERMKHGLVHIRYSDLKLLTQINDWIVEYKLKWVGGRVDKRIWL